MALRVRRPVLLQVPTGGRPRHGVAGCLTWYDGTHTGIYVLPAPAPQLTFIDLIVNAVLNALGSINFAYCAAPIGAAEAVQTDFLTENSTPNTAISLDENAQKGQSVGQHVCTG
jgi:hypothetical protein